MDKYQELKSIVIRKGGKIISQSFLGIKHKMEFECQKKHRWETKPALILAGHWCPICNKTVPYTIEDMRKFARERGGECLSVVYRNAHTKLTWKCDKGHVWEAIPKSIYLHGTWCAICKKVKKLSIEEMKQIAKEKKGKCLSEMYTNNRAKLLWECNKGHQFKMNAASVKSGKWCPRCAKNRIPLIQDMKHLAKERGGYCLSEQYKGKYGKLTWKCHNGHVWESSPAIVNRGSWCPTCGRKSKLSILDMDRIAKERGGICLSVAYVNNRTPLWFQCKDGHKWETNYGTILKGSWCPSCHQSRGEEKVRYILETFISREFKKTRKVLDNQLELDGYNADLKVAFEFRGIQHYKFVPYFHRTIKGFNELKKRNHEKEEQCRTDEIRLLIVPYWVEEKSDENLINYVKEWLDDNSILYQEKQISMATVESRHSKITEMKRIAKEKEGRCLSTVYFDSKYQYEFECQKGHRWTTSHDVIKRGGWCPKCAQNAKHSIEEMQDFARKKKGKCLSQEYVNNNTHLEWECDKGHRWFAIPSNILSGKWCPKCNKHPRLSIAVFQEIAQKQKGKCLSNVYVNQQTKLSFQCRKGHTWEALPNNIQKGKWCPSCKGNRKKTIEDCVALAKEKSGQCLSKVYVNSKTGLEWSCNKGHSWIASYTAVRQGGWCPFCRKVRLSG